MKPPRCRTAPSRSPSRRQVVARDQDVVAFTTLAADGRVLPRCSRRTLDIHLPSGRLRQYSLADPHDTDTYRIAVRRSVAGGGGPFKVHDGLAVGAWVTTHARLGEMPFADRPWLRSPTSGTGSSREVGIAAPIPPTASRLAQRLGAERGRWCTPAEASTACRSPMRSPASARRDPHRRRQRRAESRRAARRLPRRRHRCTPGGRADVDGDPAELVGRDNVELHFERFAAPPVARWPGVLGVASRLRAWTRGRGRRLGALRRVACA